MQDKAENSSANTKILTLSIADRTKIEALVDRFFTLNLQKWRLDGKNSYGKNLYSLIDTKKIGTATTENSIIQIQNMTHFIDAIANIADGLLKNKTSTIPFIYAGSRPEYNKYELSSVRYAILSAINRRIVAAASYYNIPDIKNTLKWDFESFDEVIKHNSGVKKQITDFFKLKTPSATTPNIIRRTSENSTSSRTSTRSEGFTSASGNPVFGRPFRIPRTISVAAPINNVAEASTSANPVVLPTTNNANRGVKRSAPLSPSTDSRLNTTSLSSSEETLELQNRTKAARIEIENEALRSTETPSQPSTPKAVVTYSPDAFDSLEISHSERHEGDNLSPRQQFSSSPQI